jgi:hypothetical protein
MFRKGERSCYTAVTEWRLGERQGMPTSQKDQLAAEAIHRWVDFQLSLSSEKRKYPSSSFKRSGQQQNATPN